MNGSVDKDIARRIRNSFEADCAEGILLGFAKMRTENRYDLNSKEDKLTAHLVKKIEETGFLTTRNIIIDPQHVLYDDDVLYGEGDPAKAKVIDFKFGKIWAKREHHFYAEAKNLSTKDWKKNKGEFVSASKQQRRYIKTGIEHILTGYYPKGLLLGYVVNGNVASVVAGINKFIIKYKLTPRIGLIEKDVNEVRDCCYFSNNHINDIRFALRHLMLQLA